MRGFQNPKSTTAAATNYGNNFAAQQKTWNAAPGILQCSISGAYALMLDKAALVP
ncbi:hypothetical protein [Mesorhizobium sp. B2-4-12]|uniref:hypothetical protein n=1 Tax=Mesorhizobium sp. B2-4-12 TaxID=2589937 RepID=UPI0015E331A3|nr:hypothetical protein [Mesorhizobium sp. B2-4-12]